MAEARSVHKLGAEFTRGARVALSYDDEGLHFRSEVTIPPPLEALRRVVRWIKSVYRAIYYSFFPLGPAMILALTAVVVAVVVKAPRDSWWRSGPIAQLVWSISERLPWMEVTLPVKVGILAAWTSIVGFLLIAFLQRYILRLLLTDKSFLYVARAPTLYVRLWFLAVRVLTWRRPLLYGFQSSLPKLPVPRLRDTVEKYLESARLLQTDTEFAATEELARNFLQNEGPKLQWYLNLKSWLSSNYVTDWWEKYVYLRGRSPLVVNSNYYILDSGRWHPTTVQEARAAVLTYSFCKYKEQLENEIIPPTMAADGAVPLCMWQYERMFSTARIPGRECDEVKHWDTAYSKHVAVYCRGSFYKLNVYHRDGSLRNPDELEVAFAAIKRDAQSRTPHKAEASIPALTAENRTRWAEIREMHFSDGVNRRTLRMVESALFYVFLSDNKFDTLDWTSRGHFLLSGGNDVGEPGVWFDKSVNVVVFSDGKCGINAEHSWADAPVVAHLMELAMIIGENEMKPYGDDGHTIAYSPSKSGSCGTRSGSDDTWLRVSWSLSRDAEDAILAAVESAKAIVDDTELKVLPFSDYGKDFVKRCKVSPDAYAQMAMQLAYFRDQGHFDATYESSMTRLFLHGRTETVRPVTKESCEFVRIMNDAAASPRDKLRALQAAAKRHVRGYTDAMAGGGIDRHLFALYVVSVGKGMDSPFLKAALSVPWKLSTSQQPQQQTTLWDIKDPKYAQRISPGGGFGPVDDRGYGVSYMVTERELYFHISSKRSCSNTGSERFGSTLFSCLREMRDILSLAIDEDAKGAAAAATGVKAAVPAAVAKGTTEPAAGTGEAGASRAGGAK